MNFANTKIKNIYNSLLVFGLSSLLPLSLFHSERYLINNYFITIALLLLLIIVCFRRLLSRTNLKITIIDILFAVTFSISVFSSIINDISFNATFNIKFVLYVVLFLLMKNMINYKKTVVCFHFSVLFSNLYVLIYILVLLIMQRNYLHFIEDGFGNSGVFAVYLSVSSIVLFEVFKKNKNKGIYFVLLLIIIANIILIVFLKSRISGILLLIYLLFIFTPQLKWMNKKTRILLILFILFSVLTIFSLFIKKDSTEGRFLILKISGKMIGENLLFGVGGFNSYAISYPLYQADYFASKARIEKEMMLADNIQHALNEPVQFISELGLIGFVFIIITVCKLIKYIKIKNTHGIAFVAILIASCFSYLLRTTIFQNLIFMLILIAGIRGKTYIELKSKRFCFSTFLILSAALYSTVPLISKYRDSNMLKYKIEHGYHMGDKSVRILARFKDNQTFLFPYMMQLFKNENYYECLSVLDGLNTLLNHSDIACFKAKCYKSIGDFEEAKKQFILASAICPNRFEYRYELYKLYKEEDQFEEAVNVALSIKNLKEKIPSTYTLAVKLEIERFLEENKSLEKNIPFCPYMDTNVSDME